MGELYQINLSDAEWFPQMPDAFTDFLITRPEGSFCPAGGFFIDPVRPVERALITHGHSDHARSGHGAVLASRQTLDIMAIRYGADFAGSMQAAEGVMRLGDVEVSFHPAGHVLGSAQIGLDYKGMRITVSCRSRILRRAVSTRCMICCNTLTSR